MHNSACIDFQAFARFPSKGHRGIAEGSPRGLWAGLKPLARDNLFGRTQAFWERDEAVDMADINARPPDEGNEAGLTLRTRWVYGFNGRDGMNRHYLVVGRVDGTSAMT